MSGIYVHIPYCLSKCIYCDFCSTARTAPQWSQLTDCLLAEFAERAPLTSGQFRTLYLGGGTPSLYPAAELQRLTDGLRRLSGNRWGVEEATLEVNPDDVDLRKASEWKAAGFNRVSMGLQSLDDGELQRIGRRHDARRGIEALRLLTGEFDNVSIDLMFGLPGQTPASWLRSIEAVLAERPQHISAYALTVEGDTPLARSVGSGEIVPASDELYFDMYRTLTSALRADGYEHYEISNYAQPGRRSRHNSSYWRGEAYVGLGPSAHSYDGHRVRRANPADIAGYLAAGGLPEQIAEHLSDPELAEEYLLTRLRTCEGISTDELSFYTDARALARVERTISRHVESGQLRRTPDGRVALTREGVMTSDSVLLSIASSLDE